MTLEDLDNLEQAALNSDLNIKDMKQALQVVQLARLGLKARNFLKEVTLEVLQ